MARTNIDIIVTVRDGASAPLAGVQNKLKQTGQAVRDVKTDLTQFGKTLFTVSAFIGTFTKALSLMLSSMESGGELERISNQYERVLGPKGTLFSAINAMTTTAITRMDALKGALELKNLGIAGNSEQIAGILAKAGTAAKMMGKDAADGINEYIGFLKDGSVSHLEALGLTKRTNAALQSQLAILNKMGGVQGTMISTQAKLAIGMKLLNERVAGSLKMATDLKDINVFLKDSFVNLRSSVGQLIGRALGPLMAKLAPLIFKLVDTLEHIAKNEKHIVFLTRTIILATSAIAGLVATLGTLQLIVKLLGFAGFGLPGLITGVLVLTTSFLGLTKGADGVIGKLKVLGAIFQGIYELVTNLDPETGMSKISKSTKDLLEKHGLLGFVQTIGRIVSIIKRVVQDIGQALSIVGKIIDDTFGGIFSIFINQFSEFTKGWTTWWTTDALSPIGKLARSATAILSGLFAVVGIKLLGNLAGKAMSKVPIIGGAFSGKTPKGTATDPIYTASVTKIVGGMGGGLINWGINLLKDAVISIVTIFNMFSGLGIGQALLAVGRVIGGLVTRFGIIGLIVTGVIALFNSVKENSQKWKDFFVGLGDMFIAEFPIITKIIEGLSWLGSSLWDSGKWLIDKIIMVGELVYFGFKTIFDKLAEWAGKIGLHLSEEARKKRPDLFAKEDAEKADAARRAKGIHALSNLSTATSNDEQIVQSVGEQMQNMDQASKKSMQNLMESALLSKEANGRFISPEELDGMKKAYASALANDPNLKAIATNTLPETTKSQPGRKF